MLGDGGLRSRTMGTGFIDSSCLVGSISVGGGRGSGVSVGERDVKGGREVTDGGIDMADVEVGIDMDWDGAW